jgi:hypothetical protein
LAQNGSMIERQGPRDQGTHGTREERKQMNNGARKAAGACAVSDMSPVQSVRYAPGPQPGSPFSAFLLPQFFSPAVSESLSPEASSPGVPKSLSPAASSPEVPKRSVPQSRSVQSRSPEALSPSVPTSRSPCLYPTPLSLYPTPPPPSPHPLPSWPFSPSVP